MKAIVLFGVIGVGIIWGVVAWIKAHGWLDFFSLSFILFSILFIGLFSLVAARGEISG